MANYCKEDSMIKFLGMISSKEVNDDLVCTIFSCLSENCIKAFLEDKYLAKQAFTSKEK